MSTSTFSGLQIGMDLGPQNTPPGPAARSGFGILAPANDDALLVNAGRAFTQSNGTTLNIGQTYLTLFKINTEDLTIQAWLMSASQYDMFKIGGITEDELSATTVGTGSNQLWARASAIGELEPMTTAPSHLNLYQDAFNGVSATLAEDEFRLSNVSFNEVTVVPEPGSVALITLGTGLLAMSRKRRHDAELRKTHPQGADQLDVFAMWQEIFRLKFACGRSHPKQRTVSCAFQQCFSRQPFKGQVNNHLAEVYRMGLFNL